MEEEIGRIAVETARKVIDSWVRDRIKYTPKNLPEFFDKELGVFVSIHTYPEYELRGCIGFVEPNFPLSHGLVEAAIFATRDPRFPELKEDELNKIVVEVSILTEPREIKADRPEDIPKMIKIGRDGLIVRKGFYNGLLLPQVAVEHGMDEEMFLCNTCIKAGLQPYEWKDKNTRVYVFSAEVFCEEKPYGRIVRKELKT